MSINVSEQQGQQPEQQGQQPGQQGQKPGQQTQHQPKARTEKLFRGEPAKLARSSLSNRPEVELSHEWVRGSAMAAQIALFEDGPGSYRFTFTSTHGELSGRVTVGIEGPPDRRSYEDREQAAKNQILALSREFAEACGH